MSWKIRSKKRATKETAVVFYRFGLGTRSGLDEPLAAVELTVVSKAPKDWRTPRPGGHPLALSLVAAQD